LREWDDVPSGETRWRRDSFVYAHRVEEPGRGKTVPERKRIRMWQSPGPVNRWREDEERRGGFTLIELLIVIVILGILAGIVVFAVQSLAASGGEASCVADLKAVEAALEA
jgi:prepilin-type N-terminal cleavage/methylation domain-containing protein